MSEYNLSTALHCCICGSYQHVNAKLDGKSLELDPDAIVMAVPKIRNSGKEEFVADPLRVVCPDCLAGVPAHMYMQLVKMSHKEI